MKQKLLLIILIFSTLLAAPSLADKDKSSKDKAPTYDMKGSWKVLMTNSLSRKQVTFFFDEHKDGRVRGYLISTGQEELKLDGRLDEKKNKLFAWGKYYERTGRSHEYEFRGKVKGQPGEETITGSAEFFGKRYKFKGVRGEN